METLEIPTKDIGIGPPERQIRKLDDAWVQHLVQETNPEEWDPIAVRTWPDSDPNPLGYTYQVISGYHRRAAADALNMSTLKTIIHDAPDDATFLLLAWQGNSRHGKPMSKEEQIAVAKRLRNLGMSLSDISKETGIPKGTIQNWLSGRDPNAASKLHVQLSHKNGGQEELDAAWNVAPVLLEAKESAQLQQSLHDNLAKTFDIPKVLTILATLPPTQRDAWRSLLDARIAWFQEMRKALTSVDAPSEEGAA